MTNTLVSALDLTDRLRLVDCPFAPSLERVVEEHESLARRFPRVYRSPCTRPPPELLLRLDPEGLLDLVTEAHAAWRSVSSRRTTAWQLVLYLLTTRLELERIVAARRTHPSRVPESEPASSDARR
jgi:hypothetical protein